MTYETKQNSQRTLYHCQECDEYFSETKVLVLYALVHQFLQLVIEGDEAYTKLDDCLDGSGESLSLGTCL